MKGKFATIFKDFEEVHLTKDVGMIPMAVAHINGIKSLLYYWDRTGNAIHNPYKDVLDVRGVKARCQLQFWIRIIIDLKKEHVSMVNMYHLSKDSFITTVLLKIFRIRMFLKLDLDMDGAEKTIGTFKKKISLKKLALATMIRWAYLVTVEQTRVRDKLIEVKVFKERIKLLPNAIYEPTIQYQPIEMIKRENVFLVVGRIGAYQKNHELIITALNEVSGLKNWRVVFAGPVDSEFEEYWATERATNPALSGCVEFVGNKSRTELFKLYAKSKVFILPSRWEGFSIALLEAAYMGCFIVATDVGGVRAVMDDGRLGRIVPQEDANSLAEEISAIVNGVTDIAAQYEERLDFSRQHFNLVKLIEKMECKLD